jgi:protein-disulfide isomerase
MSNSGNNYSLGAFTQFINNNFAVVVLVIAALSAGFFGGSVWTENQLLKKGVAQIAPSALAQAGNQQAPSQPQQPTTGTASIDDDPVLGDKNAPVTLIEFSDYECPFCKRYFDQTFTQIKTKYIDTGKVKLVFRDLPLSFHDPMATKEAVAANCAQKQGGDVAYFKYHDEIFKRTTSNGNGLDDEKIKTIATDIGLNMGQFESCLQDPSMADEVKKDLADAGKAGATGTPTFIIGKTTKDGKIEGSLVVGAQPFSAFEAVIEPLLQ